MLVYMLDILEFKNVIRPNGSNSDVQTSHFGTLKRPF